MSQETSVGISHDHLEDLKRLLPIGQAVVLALVLLVITFLTVLIFVLRSDVAALDDQARKAAKAANTLREEIAAIRANLDAALPMMHASTVDMADEKAMEVSRNAVAPVSMNRNLKVRSDRIDPPVPDCVVQSADPHGFADCIKRGMKN